MPRSLQRRCATGYARRRQRWPLPPALPSSTSPRAIRKEDVVAKVLAARGSHPGLVHVISAMEACHGYQPWHDKQTHRTFLRPDSGKCLHYYFYFMDVELGLVYLRV